MTLIRKNMKKGVLMGRFAEMGFFAFVIPCNTRNYLREFR
jgi:hypothetical protein